MAKTCRITIIKFRKENGTGFTLKKILAKSRYYFSKRLKVGSIWREKTVVWTSEPNRTYRTYELSIEGEMHVDWIYAATSIGFCLNGWLFAWNVRRDLSSLFGLSVINFYSNNTKKNTTKTRNMLCGLLYLLHSFYDPIQINWAIKMHFGNNLNENAASLLTIRTQTNERTNKKAAYVLQTATR